MTDLVARLRAFAGYETFSTLDEESFDLIKAACCEAADALSRRVPDGWEPETSEAQREGWRSGWNTPDSRDAHSLLRDLDNALALISRLTAPVEGLETTEEERAALADLCAEDPLHSLTTTKLLRDFARETARANAEKERADRYKAALQNLRKQYASQMQFADVDYASIYREFVRLIDAALNPESKT